MQRVVIFLVHGDQGMAGLVIGGHFLLFLGHHHRPAFGAHQDLVLGLLQLPHADDPLVLAGGQQRRLVHQVGEVGAGETRRAAGNYRGIDVRPQRHSAHVNFQDFFAAGDVRVGHHDLAVETARAQQGRIQYIGAVGGRDQNDAFVGLEPVHFDEKLVQRLLAFVVAAAQAGAAMAADSVDLIDEDNAGRILLALFEHVADPARADADEHLDEVRAGNGEERHVGFAGDRTGQQRLAGSGRADQQHALRDLAAEALELLRIAQKLDNLLDFLFRLFDPGDVLESDAAGAFGQQAGARLAEAHGTSGPRLHLPHKEYPNGDDQDDRQPGNEDGEQRVHLLVLGLRADTDLFLDQAINQLRVHRARQFEGAAGAQHALDLVALDDDVADVAVLDLAEEIGIRHLARRIPVGTALEQIEQGDQQHADYQPHGEISAEIVHEAAPFQH